jgi:hypothetical protein
MTQRSRAAIAVLFGALVLTSVRAVSATGWTPTAWAGQDTVELRTTDPGEEPHWFKVWLVVLDGQVYVRLGTRAAGRVERNQGGKTIAVRIAGQEFDKVQVVPAPDKAEAVAAEMSDKYWSDVLVHHFSHPLTARLEPEAGGS